jgi:hypothetical protein
VLREAGAADVLCLTLAAGREKPQARETCHFDE